MSAPHPDMFNPAAIAAFDAARAAKRELDLATELWVRGDLSIDEWRTFTIAWGKAANALVAACGPDVLRDLIEGPGERIRSVRDPQSPQPHTPQVVEHSAVGPQTVVVQSDVSVGAPVQMSRWGVERTSDAVTCAASPTGSDGIAAEGEGEPMAKEQSIDLLARIEVLRAKVHHHSWEAFVASTELRDLELEVSGLNEDAFEDDGGMPLSEWDAYAATADADAFAHHLCRSCGHDLTRRERADSRGFCEVCRC